MTAIGDALAIGVDEAHQRQHGPPDDPRPGARPRHPACQADGMDTTTPDTTRGTPQGLCWVIEHYAQSDPTRWPGPAYPHHVRGRIVDVGVDCGRFDWRVPSIDDPAYVVELHGCGIRFYVPAVIVVERMLGSVDRHPSRERERG